MFNFLTPKKGSADDDAIPDLQERASSDSQSPVTTPKRVKLADKFPVSDPNCPSPPAKNRDMDIGDVHSRMKALAGSFFGLFFSPENLEKTHPEEYQKLCYIIGQDLDQAIGWSSWYIGHLFLCPGENKYKLRFDAFYYTKGDVLAEEVASDEKFESYTSRIPNYDNGDRFTIFDANEHDNMVPFHRFQKSGNCFLHAPILLIWYNQLWNASNGEPGDVQLIHLSRYVRNTFDNNKLFKYIFKDSGGESLEELMHMVVAPLACMFVAYVEPYEKILENLRKYGPALVAVNNLPQEFQREGKLQYDVFPTSTEQGEGHAMLLVGIRKDKANQIFFLIQNWWERKQFIEIRNDYLQQMAGTRSCFIFCAGPLQLKDEATLYSEIKTGAIRQAQSTSLLERPFKHHFIPQRG